ncbi:MAG TPA: DUF2147 domain-containing protein [Acidobacteriaceae bacterium]|jgi:uncharacterized protein (DUF2147 family)|nr:DUF2147 domain-containing protein [Acidobacteriaceae bacterium]
MRRIWMIAILLVLPVTAHAQESGVLGEWLTPIGATVAVYRCNDAVCLKLIALSKNAPSRVDSNNPDPALRKRPLCGLQIGSGFRLAGSNHAEGGQLYDPKSGKTYSGSMAISGASNGDSLNLRGYIGIKLFGRTEVWTRAHENVTTCRE